MHSTPLKTLLFGTLFLTASFLVHAQSTWNGSANDGDWTNSANWDVAPTSGDDVTFLSALGTTTTISLNGNKTVGTLTIGDGATTGYQVGNNVATLLLNTGVNYTNTAGGSITLRPAIIDFGSNNTTWSGNGGGNFHVRANLVGSGTITKTGGHTLRFSGDNSAWTGGLVLEGGNVNLEYLASNTNAPNIFGTGSITFAKNSAVQLNRGGAEVTWTNSFINDNDEAGGSSNFRMTGGTQNGGVLSLGGDFTSGVNLDAGNRLVFDAKLGFNASTRAEGRYNLSGDWSGYTASHNIAVGDGTLQFDAQQAIADNVTYVFNSTSAQDTSGNTNVESGIDVQTSKIILNGEFAMGNNINFSNANTTDLPAGESIQSVGSTNATGTATISGDINIADTAPVNLFSQESGAKLLVSGSIGSTASGATLAINNRYSYAWGTTPPGAHELAWRNPEGIVEFTGANTYDSATEVEAGTLLVNNLSGSATGSGNLSVLSGATLGGAGTIGDGGAVDVTLSGILSPGNSPGTLTMDLGTGSLDISGAESLVFELGTTSDQVLLSSGALNVGSGVIGFSDFAFSDSGGFNTGIYTLFNTGTSVSGTLDGSDLTGTISGLDSTLSISGNDLIVTVIPEPSSILLVLVTGLAAMMFLRRRR